MTIDAFPSEPAGPFPRPPETFTDRAERPIEIRVIGAGSLGPDAEREAITAMYVTFDQADRAQGLPPSRESAVGEWLDRILIPDAVNLVAWHGDVVAGHATLVPDDEGAYELAIFVHQDYQRAGIGGRLIRVGLRHARAEGVEQVWLTVEPGKRRALKLYSNVGFDASNPFGMVTRMSRLL
jgi:GNAT superfamily N-acetyltransferase